MRHPLPFCRLTARCLILLLGLAACDARTLPTSDSPFLVKPYVQLGDAPKAADRERMVVLWQTEDVDGRWAVEVKHGGRWMKADAPTMRRVAVEGIAPHRVYRAALTGLAPGALFEYRVQKDGLPVFTARARARKAPHQPYRFVVFGDCGAGTPEQKEVAYRAYRARPDFVFITGDIVYSRGRISEYRDRFFPAYNADQAAPAIGAPLLRSTLFLAAPGNHDIGTRDLNRYPDGLAYFLYWAQPLNGPLGTPGAASTPTLTGDEKHRRAFLTAAGPNYPRMANFSFDYGNAHWTILDANGYVDWTDPALRAWVEQDLASAKEATWRFVGFHHPGFHSSKAHFDDQRMRLLADLFERGGVDIVFTGHVHNYQRTFPMRFAVERNAEGRLVAANGRVEGRWTLDRTFDGKTRTKPNGVIYLVSGAGGARLYNPEQQADPASWQPFTHRFVSRTHSLTVVDVAGRRLTVRQISKDGTELDRFVVTK